MKIANYIKTAAAYLIKLYYEFKLAQKIAKKIPTLKIINTERCNKSNKIIITVQIVGKNIFPKFEANFLANEQSILSNFSPTDIKKIISCSMGRFNHIDELLDKDLHLSAKTFDGKTKLKKFSFSYIKNGKEVIENLALKDILDNKNILLKLNQREVYDIAYTIGQEDCLKELSEMKMARESSKNH